MATKKRSYLHMPQNMMVYMSKVLSRDLRNYVGHSNAVLCTIDYVEGPVWAMQLYCGNIVHWAILEEVGKAIYVYAGTLQPKLIVPQGQFYKRNFPRKGTDVPQIGTIEENERMEVCIRWEDEE